MMKRIMLGAAMLSLGLAGQAQASLIAQYNFNEGGDHGTSDGRQRDRHAHRRRQFHLARH
jgi:hypothetical protein